MNRNTNAHFSEIPKIHINRSTFDRSSDRKFTGMVGDLIPFYYDTILPGDTVKMETRKVLRLPTLLSPVMGDLVADFYYFFVPFRLIHDHWVNIMGENSASAWAPSVTYTVPKISVPPTGTGSNNYVHSILDYLGYPVELMKEDPNNPGSLIPAQTTNIEVSAYPVRAYALIADSWFRKEALSDPINIYKGDSTVTAAPGTDYVTDVPAGGHPFKVAKFADYFSSCLPSPQRGQAVGIGATDSMAPVVTWTNEVPTSAFPSSSPTSLIVKQANGKYKYTAFATSSPFSWNGSTDYANQLAAINGAGSTYVAPTNLWANLGSGINFSVNDLRFAFQVQKLLERDARTGGRYISVILGHFGVESPDQRMQRPEYLGGNRVPININQVSNTAQTTGEFLGDVGAQSVTGDSHYDFVRSFTEHGALVGVMCLRYDHVFSQGLEDYWLQNDRLSFYWPELACISEQPVSKNQLFLTGTGTFGYNEAWASYRYKPSSVAGYMRPYISGSLGSWTFADNYSAAPSLSDSWIREDYTNVDRTLAVQSSASGFQFFADLYMNCQHTRPMPVYSIPGLIDHF